MAVKLHDEVFNNPEERDWCLEWLAKNETAWTERSWEYIVKKIHPEISAFNNQKRSESK